MKKYTIFENIDDVIYENNIIQLYGEEVIEFKSFCDAVFGVDVKELEADCFQNKYNVNDTEVEPYGFTIIAEYIRKTFGINRIRSMQFRDGVLSIKNFYTDNDGKAAVVRNGKNHV